ncbi:MAG: D-amino acid dehydrogenase, partial [Pseudomonadota bacterium]
SDVAVIGAGITGITTAFQLHQRGFDVTVIDRQRYAGMETSFANGGQLSASNAEVWTSWSTVLKGLKWMLKSDAPLLVNPKPSWHKVSWMAEFLGNIPNYRRHTVATAEMAVASRRVHHAMAQIAGIDFDFSPDGILHFYETDKELAAAARVTSLYAQGGLERRALTAEDIKTFEPTLQGRYAGGYFTESDATGDIHKYTAGLARWLEARGVRFEYGAPVDAIRDTGRGIEIDAGVRTHRAGSVVVSAGIGSRELARQLGDRVNIYPVKGYSITVMLRDEASRAAAPRVSLLDDKAKIVTSRLGADRFRVAGTAEFNGNNRDIRADRVRPLVNWVEQHFPDVCTEEVIPWAGLRPMMPSMMPRVGQGRSPRVFYNTGHGHLGWTLSAITAEMVAADVARARRPALPVQLGHRTYA